MGLTATVLICSYRRAQRLAACLDGVCAQRHTPAEIVVVAHREDRATTELVADRQRALHKLRLVFVDRPGVVAAMNLGLASASGDIVSFVDDDAVPRPDWLELITAAFAADPRTGAVGGKDVVHAGDRIDDSQGDRFLARWRPRRPPKVGHLQWFGRTTSNHNAGMGAARDVDVIKGANMSFRRRLLAEHGFDERLRGLGAQVHHEATACLPLLRSGYRVVYDPAIVVDHYPSARPHGDHRESIDSNAIRDATHNYVLALLDHVTPKRRWLLLAWMFSVGTGTTPGLVNAVRLRLAHQPEPWRRMRATQAGVQLALHTWQDVPRSGFGETPAAACGPDAQV